MTSATDRHAEQLALASSWPLVEPAAADGAHWLRRYTRALVLLDAAAVSVAVLVAVVVRFNTPRDAHAKYDVIGGLLVLTWLTALAFSRCYERRFLGSGPEEFKRVGNACVRLSAGIAMISYAAKLDLARGFVAVALPLGTVLLLLGRLGGRRALHQRRRDGRCSHRVLVLGSPQHVRELVQQLRSEPLAGLQVVGACVPGREREQAIDVGDGAPVPVVGTLTGVRDAMIHVQADTVAVTASPGLTGAALRELSYSLEGTGVDLLVAPALTNVTGTRISIRPVAGLPLLHVDEPELTGGRKVLKDVFDRTTALLLLILLVPVLAVIAVIVRLTSRGPVLFRQERVGRNGKLFRVWKFRSMYADAESRRAELEHLNEHDGVLFKIRDDPRVTPVGKWLRTYSLDEFPQLVNVLRGQMSLVGPRPPLPSEVDRYEGHTRRRLLVKPGITGLWQVNGRSNLSWDETIRLDLQYVESWSLGLDLTVLAKTVVTVLRGNGAY